MAGAGGDDAGGGRDGCRVTTHLNPGLFFHVARVILGLSAAVDLMALARGSYFVDRAGRGSLPVLHLGKAGRTRQRGRGGGNRHQNGRARFGFLTCKSQRKGSIRAGGKD